MSDKYDQDLWRGQKPVTVEEAMKVAEESSFHPQIFPHANELKALAQEIVDLRDSLEKMKAQRDGANNRIAYMDDMINGLKDRHEKMGNILGVL